MFLSDVKTRIRGEVFDYVIEQTQIALHDPAVAAKLGGLAAELSAVTGSFFLPDVRHGEAVIPESQKKTANPTFLPITRKEARTVDDMIRPASHESIRTWEITEPLHSEPYGITMDLDTIWSFARFQPQIPKESQNQPFNPLTGEAEVRFWSKLQKNQFSIGRPVVLMRYNTVMEGSRACAGTFAHEVVHTWDILRDGPLYTGAQYLAASEFRAYHVDDVIDGKRGWFEKPYLSHEVEAFRQEHADPARPFHPTPAMVAKAVELGIV